MALGTGFYFAVEFVVAAIRDVSLLGQWDDIPGQVVFTLILWGPFFLYLLAIRGATLTIWIGGALLLLGLYAYARALTGEDSTSGLQVLWLPLIGYPLVVIAGFIDRLSR